MHILGVDISEIGTNIEDMSRHQPDA